jgi:hypothetical protein
MNIHEIIRKAEQDYITGTTTISEHVEFSLKENVERIDAYLNSKHISGEKDSLGRDKPFFNIVTAAVNVWYRATDIDRANIRIKADKSSNHIAALLANVHSQQWMRREGFGAFLNEWGRALARYGSAIVKFVEKDGRLIPSVVPWNRVIIDPVDFENNVKIEVLYLTPSQLRKNKAYDQEVVEALIEAQKQSRETLGGQKKDTKAEYIKIYEVHGELEDELITGKESDTYSQQMHVCSFLQNEEGEYSDFSLYSGREKDPYMITHLIKEDGRAMGIGAVEHLFEAQWMVNHNEKAIKDQLDLASKLVFQGSDPNLQGRNLFELDNGTFILHAPNEPMTQLANSGHDIATALSSKQEWRNQGMEVTSTPDAIRGNTMPSGTAARQVEALQQESGSLFELMTENKGLHIIEMWQRFVIPHIKKKLDTKEEIAATLDQAGIKQIDAMYIPNEAKRRHAQKAIEMVLNDEDPMPFDPATAEKELSSELMPLGSQRFFSPDDLGEKSWKEVFKDLEWEVEVEVTNEAHDKQSTLVSLATVLQTLASMGDVENARLVLAKILEETGIFSPLELAESQSAPAPALAPTS